MRLSEAIRLGATMKPQGFYRVHFEGTSCALGAVEDALGITDEEVDGGQWKKWPANLMRVLESGPPSQCPECGYRADDLGLTITHLNDHHQWTRERIADFVELHELTALEPTTITEEQEQQCPQS